MGQEEEEKRLALMHEVHARLGVLMKDVRSGKIDRFGDSLIGDLSKRLKWYWEVRDYAGMLRAMEDAYISVFHKWDSEDHERVKWHYDYQSDQMVPFYPMELPDFGQNIRRGGK